MSKESVEKTERVPRKRKQFLSCLVGLGCFVAGFVLSNWHPFPLNTMPIDGTIVILNENGEAIPFQPTELKCFARYAPGFFRSDWNRMRNRGVAQSETFSSKIPRYNATLLFSTKDGRYAALVDIDPDKPTTGLIVELRPRHTVTGRLVDSIGTPLANVRLDVQCFRYSDKGARVPFGWVYSTSGIFHSKRITTDSEGFFSFDDAIPGGAYWLTIVNPLLQAKEFELPIFQPEQYQVPYDLGDVVVRQWER